MLASSEIVDKVRAKSLSADKGRLAPAGEMHASVLAERAVSSTDNFNRKNPDTLQ